MHITLRPHHVLCTIGFQGKGYNEAFVENFLCIKKTLTARTHIHFQNKADDICKPCPHKLGTLCKKETKIQELDARHQHALKLSLDVTYTWHELLERVHHNIEPHTLDFICKGCEWKKLGVCKTAVQQLKKSFHACQKKQHNISF